MEYPCFEELFFVSFVPTSSLSCYAVVASVNSHNHLLHYSLFTDQVQHILKTQQCFQISKSEWSLVKYCINIKNHDNDDQRMCGQSPLVIVAESQRTGPPVEKAMVVVVLSLLSFLSMITQLNNMIIMERKKKTSRRFFSDQKHITPV